MFAGRINVTSSFTFSDTATGTQNTIATSLIEQTETYAEGNGANQAEFAYSKSESSAAAQTYDLNGGTLYDQVGRAIALTKLNAVVVRNTGTVSITVEDGAANPLSMFGIVGDKVTIAAGGCLILTWPSGLTIDATHKNVKITPSAAATWQVQFVGSN